MFTSESRFQQLIHEDPNIILSGIPEIDPNLCSDTPTIVSLGREIRLDSGPIDNLYIDTNAVLTFVECKRYSDSRLKREVYSQAINYAADMQSMLMHYFEDDFINHFFEIIRSNDESFESFDHMLNKLADDPILTKKNKSDWRRQFKERLEYNIKNGVCRIVIACAPDPRTNFSFTQIRNLMKLMQYSESSQSRYDLILMDVRELDDEYVSKVIWRSYAALPLIPLIATTSRNESQNIENLHKAIDELDETKRNQLENLVTLLDENGIYTKDNSAGLALYWKDSNKSLYVQLKVTKLDWSVRRHQIRPTDDQLFGSLGRDCIPEEICQFNPIVKETSGSMGKLYEIAILRIDDIDLVDLALVIKNTLGVENFSDD